MDYLAQFPKPRPDAQLFKDTLESGFKKFPERKENYLRYQSANRGEILEYLPIRLDVENVSRCNYRCNMCQVSSWKNSKRAEDMTFSDFRKLLEKQYGLIEIKLQGMGEPLLSPAYFRMIDFARKRNIWVRSTTNGSLLHHDDNYKKLIDSDISEIQVSIDGVTDATYRRIRKGGNLKRVKDNSILLNKYASKHKRIFTRMWVVAQKENFHELEFFPALAARLGFNRLSMTIDLNSWGQSLWLKKIAKSIYMQSLI